MTAWLYLAMTTVYVFSNVEGLPHTKRDAPGKSLLILYNDTRVKTHNLFKAVKTALFNVWLPTLLIVANNIEQYC